MATTLQQLLDDLTDRITAPTPATTIEDVAGALSHLGRALAGLVHDGLTPGASQRQRTTADLGAACVTAGGLWPRAGGPLIDLAGAAADLVGRDRDIMGRSHRWAVTVELAAVADHCARLGHRMLPRAAVTELTAVRRLAAATERDAQAKPPTASGVVVLDRLVPPLDLPRAGVEVTPLDAAAALVAAVERAQRAESLSLRDFRAAVAAAEITSRYAAAVVAATAGEKAEPPLVAAVAWQLAGRISMACEDGHPGGPRDPRGVVSWARTLADALRADLGSHVDTTAFRDRDDFSHVLSRVRQVTNQMPVIADQLAAAVGRWSRTGQLFVDARELPPMDDMPEQRIHDVISGRYVEARGSDLDHLRHVVHQAGVLSTALAVALNRATPAGPTVQRHLTSAHASQLRAPGAAQELLSHANDVAQAVAHFRSPRVKINSPASGTGGTVPY